MLRRHLLGLIAITLGTQAAAKAPLPVVPLPLRGVWMADNAAGQQQCREYLAALRKNRGAAGEKLVGAEVIGPGSHHSYAEYGEGNFYQPISIAAITNQKWRVQALLGIDGMPEPGDPGSAAYTYSLKAGKLSWRLLSIAGKPVANQGEGRYFRCTSAPPGTI